MLVSDILRAKGGAVAKVQATDRVSAAVQQLSARRIGALMVEDRWMKLVGIFSERDLVNAVADRGPAALDMEVRELMTAPFLFGHSTDRIDAVLGLMTAKKIRHLPIIDDGELTGIVSIGDLVKHRLDEKELENNVLLELSRFRG